MFNSDSVDIKIIKITAVHSSANLMQNTLHDLIISATGAKSVSRLDLIQRLWSGYGEIVRYGLTGCDRGSVIVKHVKLSGQGRHPGGWNTDWSHQRKLWSYQVEMTWYEQWSRHCDEQCRVPACLASAMLDDDVVLVLNDLDGAGFPQRRSRVSAVEMNACLNWLANFHATFMGKQPDGLWPTGTYWHLQTRPDELQALQDQPLKNAASAIDQILRDCRYQTFVHGDAKLANFCFSADGSRVAAVDFQYVGGGCGIKDVAYFIDSCLSAAECERQEKDLLAVYFQVLKQALQVKHPMIDAAAVEQEWRALYPVAWTDFHRFLKGWSVGHWSRDSYSERVARRVIAQLPQSNPG